MMASGEIRLSSTMMRRMPVLAQSQNLTQSGCYSVCLPSDTGNSTASFVFSIPGVAVDPNVPASFSIAGSVDLGFYSIYTYQLNNANGTPLTGPGYSAAEYISPADTSINANGIYMPLNNGQLSDRVGFVNPPTVPANIVTTQTFTALYQGYFYDLSTVFQHQNISSYGSPYYIVTNTVTVINP
jgi:hypothetical protein